MRWYHFIACFFGGSFCERYSTLHQRRVRASLPNPILLPGRSEDGLRQL